MNIISKYIRYRKNKNMLLHAFKMSGIYLEKNSGSNKFKVFPIVRKINFDDKYNSYTFSLLSGIDPELITNKEYVFKQVFGKNIEFIKSGNEKNFTLKVYKKGMPNKINYRYKKYKETIERMKIDIPVLCGVDASGEMLIFDLKKFHHVQVTGITNSGKSVYLNSVLVTLINHFKPEELNLYLADLKRTELSIYKNIEHAKFYASNVNQLKIMLKKVKSIVDQRFDLMEKAGVRHVDELKEKMPIIIVMIDEYALASDDSDIMDLVREITSVCRASNTFFFLALQRADSSVITGIIKNNLGVKISFKQSDSINSRIAGFKKDTIENIRLDQKGRAMIDLGEIKMIQCPLITTKQVKRYIKPYIVKKADTDENKQSDNTNESTLQPEQIFNLIEGEKQ